MILFTDVAESSLMIKNNYKVGQQSMNALTGDDDW